MTEDLKSWDLMKPDHEDKEARYTLGEFLEKRVFRHQPYFTEEGQKPYQVRDKELVVDADGYFTGVLVNYGGRVFLIRAECLGELEEFDYNLHNAYGWLLDHDESFGQV